MERDGGCVGWGEDRGLKFAKGVQTEDERTPLVSEDVDLIPHIILGFWVCLVG